MSDACAALTDILAPANLSEHKKILEAKNQIAVFAEKLDRYKKRYFEEVDQRESEIKKAFTENESLKRHILIGFEKGKKTSNRLMNEYFHVENESVQKIKEILDFLSEKSGPFWESDGVLVFERDEDVDMFNQLIQNLNEHSQKEDLILNKLERYRQSVLQEAQNLNED